MEINDTVPYVLHSINGQDIKFKKLSLNDIYLNILASEKNKQKLSFIENLKVSGASTEIMFNELERFDKKKLTFDDFIEMLNDISSLITVVQYCHKQIKENEGKILELNAQDITPLLGKLTQNTGIQFNKKIEEITPKEETEVKSSENKDKDKDIDPSTGKTWAYGR